MGFFPQKGDIEETAQNTYPIVLAIFIDSQKLGTFVLSFPHVFNFSWN